jgi:hypothetical protein
MQEASPDKAWAPRKSFGSAQFIIDVSGLAIAVSCLCVPPSLILQKAILPKTVAYGMVCPFSCILVFFHLIGIDNV